MFINVRDYTTLSREPVANLESPVVGTSLTTATPLKNACEKKDPAALKRRHVGHLKVENGINAPFSRNDKGEGSSGLVPVFPIAVTVKQAANLIGTNDKHIRAAIYARELPVLRLGKSYHIAVSDLTEWFNRKKRTL